MWATVVDWFVLGVVFTAIAAGLWAAGVRSLAAPAVWFGLIPALYEVALTTWVGQTVGKRVLRMVVVDDDNRYPNVAHSMLRYVVKSLFPLGLLLPPAIGVRIAFALYPFMVLASIVSDPHRRGWHDRAAGTTVLWTTTRRPTTKRISDFAPWSEPPSEPPPLPDPWSDSPYGRYRKRRVRRR